MRGRVRAWTHASILEYYLRLCGRSALSLLIMRTTRSMHVQHHPQRHDLLTICVTEQQQHDHDQLQVCKR